MTTVAHRAGRGHVVAVGLVSEEATTGSCAVSGQAVQLAGGVEDGAATPKLGGVVLMVRRPCGVNHEEQVNYRNCDAA